MDNFNVINENNEFQLGTIIAIFTLPNYNREFALFAVGSYDGDTSDLHVAYLDKDSEGFDYISEIDDAKVFADAVEASKSIVMKLNNY